VITQIFLNLLAYQHLTCSFINNHSPVSEILVQTSRPTKTTTIKILPIKVDGHNYDDDSNKTRGVTNVKLHSLIMHHSC